MKVLIEYDVENDSVVVKSEFKDVNDTLKLIALGYDKWLKERVGLKCEDCGAYIETGWEHCPKCGKEI